MIINIDNIIVDPNSILRKKAQKVSFPLEKDDIELIEAMITYVRNSKNEELCEQFKLLPAVGIAAPQVGVSKRMCVINVDEYNDEGEISQTYEYALINPVILSESNKKAALKNGEGCLSIKDEHPGYVVRPARIKLKAFDYITQSDIILSASDYLAIVIQHELDHLNGVLFYDRINNQDPWHEDETLLYV